MDRYWRWGLAWLVLCGMALWGGGMAQAAVPLVPLGQGELSTLGQNAGVAQESGALPPLVPRPPSRPQPWPPVFAPAGAVGYAAQNMHDMVLGQYLQQIRLRLTCIGPEGGPDCLP